MKCQWCETAAATTFVLICLIDYTQSAVHVCDACKTVIWEQQAKDAAA